MNHAPDTPLAQRRSPLWVYLGVTLAAAALLLGTAIPAAAAELMRVTFVRHGQSLGNASGSIDSSTPGPVLSQLGQQQSAAVVGKLGDRNFDAIYASSMVRTQLTAAPMSQYLGLPIQILPGLQEIEAGDYEGTPERDAASGYMLAPLAWSLQGDLNARIPGSIDGNEFDARMDGALATMYDKGDRNVAVFSHGAAMMFWTFMNVDNLTAAQKMDLLRQSLSNTAYVVVEGNPEDGWTLVNWNGRQFSQERTFGAELKLQVRTLTRQLTAAAQSVAAAFATGDVAAIATAINRGIGAAGFSLVKFSRAVAATVIDRLSKVASGRLPSSSPAVLSEVPASEVAAAETGGAVAETISPAAHRDNPAQTSVTLTAGMSDSPKPQAIDASPLLVTEDVESKDVEASQTIDVAEPSQTEEPETVGKSYESNNQVESDTADSLGDASADTKSQLSVTKRSADADSESESGSGSRVRGGDNAKSDGPKSDSTKSDSTKSDGPKSDNAKSDSAKSDNAKSGDDD